MGVSLLSIAVVVLPLWRGGVSWEAQLGAAVVVPLALLLATRSESRLPGIGLALGAVLGVMVLQLLPLPAALHGLSPAAKSLFEATLGPLGLYPAARPLSLDPSATATETAKAVVGLSAFGVAWAASTGRRRRVLAIGAVAASGLAVAAVVLGGAIIGASPLLAPSFPFVNPNHLAGFSVLTSFPLLGLAVRARGQERALWLLGFSATASMVFLSLSRGGIAAFVVGVGIFAALALRRRTAAGEHARQGHVAIAAGVAGALAIAAFLSLEPLLGELATSRGVRPESKTALWTPALTMVSEYPWLGIGRGAFEAAFTAYKTDAEQLTFTHLENEWLQPLVELGIPAGFLLVVTLLLAWLGAARRRDLSWVEVGLLAGTGALAAQNVVDFSLELLGVTVPFMAALGLATRGGGPIHFRRWTGPAVAMAFCVVAVAGLARSRAHPPESEAQAIASATDTAAMLAAARDAAARRPADFVPQATAGVRLVEAGRCAEALPWLTRAMLLNPTAPEPHLHAARCLASSGQRVVALREFRLAWTYGRRDALAEAELWFPALGDLLEAVPATPEGLGRLGDFLAGPRPADAAAVYGRLFQDFADGKVLVPLARATWQSGDRAAGLALARRRATEQPQDAAAWRLLADMLLQAGDEAAGAAAAEQGLVHSAGSPLLLEFLFDRAFLARRHAEALGLAERITAHSSTEVGRKLLLVARAQAGQGRLGEALETARAAAGAQPDAPDPWLAVADYCERANRHDDAIAAVERAASLPGQPPGAFRSRLDALAAARDALVKRRQQQGLER